MRRLIFIALLCGCVGSLVDHTVMASQPDGGGTPECAATCLSTPYPSTVAAPLCLGSTCTYRCLEGKLKCATGCCDASAIAAGDNHTCAVTTGGEVRCWGLNDKRQLGRDPGGGVSSVTPPELVGKTVTAVAAGSAHTCALVQSEGVWCWGDNTSKQSGDPVPHKVAGSEGALRIAAGNGHTCFATASQTSCWGANDKGQVGNGIAEASPRTAPTPVSGIGGAVRLAAGDDHTCAIDGTNAFCWGANDRGQVGNGTTTSAVAAPGPAIMSGAGFLGLGANHSCAGSTSDALSCWGANASAQVDRSGQDQRSPKGVLSNVIAVAGGTGHTCAIRRGGGVTCWGRPAQLGVVTSDDGEVDVQLPGPVEVITARSMHTCVIQGGAVLCWGSNQAGQLGVAGGTDSVTPVLVDGR